MLSVLSDWMDENSTNLNSYTEYGRSGKIFTGTEIIAHFDNLGIGRESFSDLQVICSCRYYFTVFILNLDICPFFNDIVKYLWYG